jgi:hypothetical protein
MAAPRQRAISKQEKVEKRRVEREIPSKIVLLKRVDGPLIALT